MHELLSLVWNKIVLAAVHGGSRWVARIVRCCSSWRCALGTGNIPPLVHRGGVREVCVRVIEGRSKNNTNSKPAVVGTAAAVEDTQWRRKGRARPMLLRKPEATPRESCRFQIVIFDCTIKIKLPGSETMEQNEGKPGERNPGIKDMY